MVNHVRTLLLNLPAVSEIDPPPGEEYVPPAYVPKFVEGPLADARAALFGAGADRAGMNLTLARVLGYLHASALGADAFIADPRITYDPARPGSVFGSVGPAVTSGPPIAGWMGAAGFAAPGRAFGTWTVVTTALGAYTVVPGGIDPPQSGPVAVVATGWAVPLPGSQLLVVVPAGTAAEWTVTVLAPPAHDWTEIADLTDAQGLFRPGAGGSESNWYAVWADDGPPADRAVAAALALSARTAEL
jgi:hypothetical protein